MRTLVGLSAASQRPCRVRENGAGNRRPHWREPSRPTSFARATTHSLAAHSFQVMVSAGRAHHSGPPKTPALSQPPVETVPEIDAMYLRLWLGAPAKLSCQEQLPR